MLTELKFEDGNVRFKLANNVNFSVITGERRRETNVRLASLFNGKAPLLVPPGMVEVALTNEADDWFDTGGRIEEWESSRVPNTADLPIYHVTEQQVLDYINKVGVK